MNAYKGYKCIITDETGTISTTLSQIDKSVEFIFLTNGVSNNIKIDFNSLPRKMIVMLQMGDNMPESRFLSTIKKLSQAKFDGTHQGIINFAKKMKKDTNNKISFKAEEEERDNIKLVGNIKDKVSFLIVSSLQIEIVESDLNIHTLFMYGGTLSPLTQFKIKTTYFITNYGFQEEIINQLPDHSYINSEYYQLSELEGKITVNFEKESLNVNVEDVNVEDENNNEQVTVPYDVFQNSIGLIVHSGDVVLNAGADSVVQDSINITFTKNFIPLGPLGTFDYESLDPSGGKSTKNQKIREIEKNKVTITKSGDYWNDNKNLKIVINADPNFYDIDTKDLDGFAEISSNPMYSFGDKVEGNDGNEKDDTNTDNPKKDKNKLSTGAIVEIVVGCVAFVAIVIVVIVIVVNKKKGVGNSSS